MRNHTLFLIVAFMAVFVACVAYFVLPTAAYAESAAAGPITYTYYTVRQGDNLSSIARRYGVTTTAIVRANNLRNPSKIYAGQRLKIPRTAAPPKATPRPVIKPPVIAPTPVVETPSLPSLVPTTRPSS